MGNQQTQENLEPQQPNINTVGQPDGLGDDQAFSSDDTDAAGAVTETSNLERAEAQVRENEDASLQDDTYTFDSDNTDSEEGIDDFDVEDVGGGMSDFDVDNNDDYV